MVGFSVRIMVAICQEDRGKMCGIPRALNLLTSANSTTL